MSKNKLGVAKLFGGASEGGAGEGKPKAPKALAKRRVQEGAPIKDVRPARPAQSALAAGIGRGVGRPPRDTEPYTFRLPPDLHRKFDAITRSMGKRPMSAYVEEWIASFVEENGDYLPPALKS